MYRGSPIASIGTCSLVNTDKIESYWEFDGTSIALLLRSEAGVYRVVVGSGGKKDLDLYPIGSTLNLSADQSRRPLGFFTVVEKGMLNSHTLGRFALASKRSLNVATFK